MRQLTDEEVRQRLCEATEKWGWNLRVAIECGVHESTISAARKGHIQVPRVVAEYLSLWTRQANKGPRKPRPIEYYEE